MLMNIIYISINYGNELDTLSGLYDQQYNFSFYYKLNKQVFSRDLKWNKRAEVINLNLAHLLQDKVSFASK